MSQIHAFGQTSLDDIGHLGPGLSLVTLFELSIQRFEHEAFVQLSLSPDEFLPASILCITEPTFHYY